MMTVQDLQKVMEIPVPIFTVDDAISTVKNTPPDHFGEEVVTALDEDEEPTINTPQHTTSVLNVSGRINTGKSKTTNTAIKKQVKVGEPSSSSSYRKEYYRSQSLKTDMEFFYCHLCKRRIFFMKNAFTLCMVCKNKVCVQCTGPTGFDYICHKCLE